MAENRGKKFESIIKEAFLEVPEVSVDRIHDQMNMYKGSQNICDFIVYKKPYEYYIECKSVHGNTLSIHSNPKKDKHGVLHGFYGNITDTQWEGLLEKAKIEGVMAGILCWWVEKDKTMFLPITILYDLYHLGYKSVRFDDYKEGRGYYMKYITLKGKKKRIFFEYDMEDFFKQMEECYAEKRGTRKKD